MKLSFVIFASLILLGITSGCRAQSREQLPDLTEASGVVVVGSQLVIVSDDEPGTLFIYDIALPIAGVMPLVDATRRVVRLGGCELASDLESVEQLADGRIVVLSEDLHALFAADPFDAAACQLVAQFDASLTELAGRGLEGLAVKRLPNGASRIAVSWEGGYLGRSALPPELVERIGDVPLTPTIVVTDIPAHGSAGYVDKPIARFSPRVAIDSFPPPRSQRFRCPDLVWHTWSASSGNVDGLILLLTSQDSPPNSTGEKPRFQHKWLVRCDVQGKIYGEPLDLSVVAAKLLERFVAGNLSGLNSEQQRQVRRFEELVTEGRWENVNWEGLAWFEAGKSLIAIYDGVPFDPPIAFVIPVPEEWR